MGGFHPNSMERDLLLPDFARLAYTQDPNNLFTLASGQFSSEYVDCQKALSHYYPLQRVGILFKYELHKDAVAIGGPTMGADPIGIATTMQNPKLRWFSVRKTAKATRADQFVEGDVSPGEGVTIVDDIVTAGSATIQAILKARDFGLKVIQVLVLVDREQGGLAKIRQVLPRGTDVRACFTLSEVREAWRALPRGKA